MAEHLLTFVAWSFIVVCVIFNLARKKRNFRAMTVQLVIITALIIPAVTSSSCSKKSSGRELTVMIVNGGDRSGKNERKPITISVYVDGKPVDKMEKITLSDDRPQGGKIVLQPGAHPVKIEETTTGASTQSIVDVQNDLWFLAVFYRETEDMGVFETRTQAQPPGYEWFKAKKEAPKADLKTKPATINDEKVEWGKKDEKNKKQDKTKTEKRKSTGKKSKS